MGALKMFFQIGTITLNIQWGAFILATVLLMLMEKFIYKKASLFQDMLFYYVLVWKFSYIALNWTMFIQNPMSALYFNGGVLGHILGIAIAGLLLLLKTKKHVRNQGEYSLFFSFFVFYILFQGSIYFLSGDWVVGMALFIVLLMVTFRSNKNQIGWLILFNCIFLAYEKLIFEIEGWTFLVITTIALIFMIMKENLLLKNVISWCIVVILASAAALNFEKTNTVMTVGKAADFELQTLSGDTIQLSDYQGKKVILNFWATWCPPCKAEMPHMQKFYEEHGDEVEVIAVNLTSRDNGKEALASFIEEYGLTFPIPLDEEGEYGEIYEVISIPTTYVIDEKGDILHKIVGPLDQSTLESL